MSLPRFAHPNDYGQPARPRDLIELLMALREARYEHMPEHHGSMYFGRFEPPPSLGGYRLAWAADVLAQPECGIGDMTVAGWIVECSDGGLWYQYGTKKVYETNEMAAHSIQQIRRTSPNSTRFRTRPVYLMGRVSTRLYNIYKVVGPDAGAEHENQDHE